MNGLRYLAFAALALFAFTSARAEGTKDDIPESLQGFSGQVRGVVVSKGEKDSLRSKVARLLRTWEGNKASDAKAIVGRTVRVVPSWHKGDDGKWRPYELHVSFIRKLKVGQEMTLEIRNVEGPRNFQILELSEEQRAFARGGKD